jgi:hypothetical protein
MMPPINLDHQRRQTMARPYPPADPRHRYPSGGGWRQLGCLIFITLVVIGLLFIFTIMRGGVHR